MIAGLFVGAVLCAGAEPQPEPAPRGATEAQKDALARYGAAVWNVRRERLLSAVKQLEAVAKDDPDAAEPRRELVRLYAQLGREPRAIELARKLLDKDPDDGDTAALLARLLFDAGELKDAVAAAKLAAGAKALADRPDRAVRVYRDLATLCEKAGDLATAEAALRKAVELLTEGRAAVIRAAAFTPKEADTEAADLLERLGQVLVKRAQYEPAAEAFAAAAKLYADPKKVNDPASAARLSWNLSGALEARGDATAALKYLQQFLKYQPRAAEPYQRLARVLRAAGRGDDVVPTLQQYADRDKLNRPLAAVLAAEMAADPATRRAADELFAALTGETHDPAVVAVVVRSHLDTRRAGEIIKDVDRAFAVLKEKDKEKDKPETPETAAAREFAGAKARAYADALFKERDGVDALLRAAGDDLKAGHKRAYGTYFYLGSLAFRARKLELATLQFEQAVRLAPRDSQSDAYTALFQVHWLANKPDKIEELCAGVLAVEDVFRADVFFNYHRARALAELGKTADALTAADSAIKQAGDADRLTVRLRRHLVLCIGGRWDEAIEYGTKLADQFDAPADRARIRHAQAAAYWGAKKPAEAEAVLRAILDDDPDNAQACNELGYHLADQGRNLAEAERLVRHAIATDRIDRRKAGSAEPESAAYRDSLGWVLFRRGDLAGARAALETAAALPGGAADPVVWDHLGDVLFRAGEKAKAKAAWEKARDLYDADPRASARGRRDGLLAEVKRKLARVP